MRPRPLPGRPAPPGVARVISGQGRSLSSDVRRRFEPAFGTSFDQVRVHEDASAPALDANAYTVGEHVVFAPGMFAPRSPVGSRRLAHELAHVVQQRALPGTHRHDPAREPTVLPHGTRAEQQAHRAARYDTTGIGSYGPVEDLGLAVARGPVLQRQPRGDDAAHYPDPDEQSRIERLLRRERQVTPSPSTATPTEAPTTGEAQTPERKPKPVVTRGRTLSEVERAAVVARLVPVLVRDLTAIAGRATEQTRLVSEDDAMKVVERARELVLDRYGDYTRQITLTRVSSLTPAQRRARDQVLVEFVDTGDAGRALARTRIDTECATCRTALADADDESREDVVRRVLDILDAEQSDLLRRAALKGVGGSHSTATIRVPPRGESGLGTAVHELIHELAHPAFAAAFLDERNIVEGFTEYFTRQIVSGRSNYEEIHRLASRVGSLVSGPFLFSGRGRGEESMRLAYFQGRLDLIGWVPTSPKEAEAVRDAGGSEAWDPGMARARAAQERAQDVAAQSAHGNVLGTGLFFQQSPGVQPVIAVRYARVLATFDPLARGRLVAEGQLIASSTGSPVLLGGSLGLAVEYQEPWFYATAGARLAGSGVLGLEENRIDVSPFLGTGVRLWNVVRVGGEGFVLVPAYGSGINWGAGATVGVEF